MKNHFLALGVLHTTIGLIELLVASFFVFAVVGGGLISGNLTAIGVTSLIGVGIGAAFAVTAIPSILGGLGLLCGKEWSRIVLLIVGILSIPLVIPFGTILGVYTIWVLTRPEAAEMLSPETDGAES